MKPSTLKRLRQLNPMPDYFTPGEILIGGITAEENWDDILTAWYNGCKSGYEWAVLKANPDFKMP